MKVQLEPIADAAAETYTVRLSEDDGSGARAVTGRVVRIGPDTWELTPFYSEQNKHGPSIKLHAKTADDLRESMSVRLGAVDIKSDRLTNSAMAEYVRDSLLNMYSLADTSNSKSGFFNALVHAAGVFIHNEIPAGQRAAFVENLTKHIGSAVDAQGRIEKMREAAEGFVRDHLSNALGADDDTPKH
jgi:hypothetical protein